MAKYFEIWSLYVYRVYPHVPSLTTPPPSPTNLVQNKHVKIFHRFRVLYLCTAQRVLQTQWESRRFDWTRLGRCEHPLTLEYDWTGLDSTRLCWCVRTLTDCAVGCLQTHSLAILAVEFPKYLHVSPSSNMHPLTPN